MKCSDRQTDRQTGIELLRIVAMFWIIMFHFSDHGVVDMDTSNLNMSWGILAFARIGGGLGNCVFVLISGYVLCDKPFKLSRILKLWAEVFFYSVIIGSICYCLSIVEFTPKSFIKMIFPIISKEYWYMSTYVILYLIYPFLTVLINNLDRKQFEYLIFLTIICFSAIPTFAKAYWLTGTNNLSIFITLFFVGTYIKKFHISGFKRNSLNYLCFVTIGIMIWISELLSKLIGSKNPFYFLWDMYKLPVVLMAILMFLSFNNMKLKESSVISALARTVFGVYLIHMGRLGDYLFKDLINNETVYDKPFWMLIYLIVTSVCIFMFCSIIDIIRAELIEKKVILMLKNKTDNIDKSVSVFLQEKVKN